MAAKELDMIRDAGVVGAGGAGFPTHVKLDSSIDTLIINGAECEPLINVDKQLLEHRFDRVYKGIKTAAALVGAGRTVLAVKEKNKKAIEAVESFNAGGPDFEIYRLDDFYPAGDEQVLVNEVTGNIVPEGGIPIQVGAVVINVETLLNVAGAVEGSKVTHKYVTVNGEVNDPMTLMVPVGTPVKLLLDHCGGLKSQDAVVVDGGPMMGKLIEPESYAVKKTTKSIIAFTEDSIMAENLKRQVSSDMKRAQAICLSCRMCTDLCPRYLLGHDLFPDELMKRLYKGKLTDEEIKDFDYAWLCCDCGLCELYACVVDLSGRSVFNYLKGELARLGIKNPHKRTDLKVNEFREFRKVPVSRLRQRLEIDKYDSPTPLASFDIEVDMVKLYLTQHIGAPSVPVVNEGDMVQKGDIIADIPEGGLGSKIHSSIDGRIAKIKTDQVVIEK
jgi:Na+-translocating ferredoxin:NAD+ oxidoreductase RnfC subunit